METKFLTQKYLGNTLGDIFIAFGIILVFGILSKIVRYFVKHKLSKLADFTETDFDNKLLIRLEKPIGNYVIIFGLSLAKTFLTFTYKIDTILIDTITALAIVNTGYLIFKVSDLFLELLFNLSQKTKLTLDDEVVKYLSKSVKIFIVLLTLIIVIENYVIFSSKQTTNILHKIFIAFITINIIYILLKLTDALVEYFKPVIEKTPSKLDDQLLPMIRKIIKIVIVIIGILSILKNLGYDISTLLAGLGIGGLAVALAAQDTIANFFG
ncbi:MAG TPA: mechanosensitive ion channel, partial [bacterium]|nr:mechanosensitive ion channel [bacterium]